MKIYEKIEVSANANLGKYNLVQYKNNPVAIRAKAHKSVCKAIIDYIKNDNRGIPAYVICQVGISKGAFKSEEFDRGYQSIDLDKVTKVSDMAYAFNEMTGHKDVKPTDVTWRICQKYYERKSTSLNQFKQDLQKAIDLGCIMTGARGTFAEATSALGID